MGWLFTSAFNVAGDARYETSEEWTETYYETQKKAYYEYEQNEAGHVTATNTIYYTNTIRSSAYRSEKDKWGSGGASSGTTYTEDGRTVYSPRDEPVDPVDRQGRTTRKRAGFGSTVGDGQGATVYQDPEANGYPVYTTSLEPITRSTRQIVDWNSSSTYDIFVGGAIGYETRTRYFTKSVIGVSRVNGVLVSVKSSYGVSSHFHRTIERETPAVRLRWYRLYTDYAGYDVALQRCVSEGEGEYLYTLPDAKIADMGKTAFYSDLINRNPAGSYRLDNDVQIVGGVRGNATRSAALRRDFHYIAIYQGALLPDASVSLNGTRTYDIGGETLYVSEIAGLVYTTANVRQKFLDGATLADRYYSTGYGTRSSTRGYALIDDWLGITVSTTSLGTLYNNAIGAHLTTYNGFTPSTMTFKYKYDGVQHWTNSTKFAYGTKSETRDEYVSYVFNSTGSYMRVSGSFSVFIDGSPYPAIAATNYDDPLNDKGAAGWFVGGDWRYVADVHQNALGHGVRDFTTSGSTRSAFIEGDYIMDYSWSLFKDSYTFSRKKLANNLDTASKSGVINYENNALTHRHERISPNVIGGNSQDGRILGFHNSYSDRYATAFYRGDHTVTIYGLWSTQNSPPSTTIVLKAGLDGSSYRFPPLAMVQVKTGKGLAKVQIADARWVAHAAETRFKQYVPYIS